MRKKTIFGLLALFLFISLISLSQVHGQTSYINVTDSINQTSNVYAENIVNYSILLSGANGTFVAPIPANSYDISVYLNGTNTNFVYQNLSSYLILSINGINGFSRLDILFTYNENVNVNDSYFMDTYYFIPPSFTSYFKLDMLLPEGAYAVTSNKPNNYGPSVYGFFTNGKRIDARWIIENQSYSSGLYVIIPFYLGYKLSVHAPQQQSDLLDIIYILIAIVIAILGYELRLVLAKKDNTTSLRKRKARRYNPFNILLSGDEKRILSFIPKDDFIMQNEVVQKSGYSKAKVSKIVSKLSRYRFVKVIPEGRNNKLKRN